MRARRCRRQTILATALALFAQACAFAGDPPLASSDSRMHSRQHEDGITRTPIEAVPPDARVVLLGGGVQPARTEPRPGGYAVNLLAFLADQVGRTGLIAKSDVCTRAWIDGLAALPLLFRYPHAIVLMDINANAREDGGHELAGIQAALILRTNGQNDSLRLRIQHVLNSYTNNEETTLTKAVVKGYDVFSLTDHRLPAWVQFSWGAIDDLYFLTLGEGAFEQIADTLDHANRSMAADPWFASASKRLGTDQAPAVLYLRLDELAESTDRLLTRKIHNVQASLGLRGVDRTLWTFKQTGRAVQIDGVVLRNGQDEHLTVASAVGQDSPLAEVIPEAATGYSVVDLSPGTVVHAVSKAYLAAKSPGAREKIRAFWTDLQTQSGVNIERDILAHLGKPIIIHDYPPHILKLPLALSIVVPITGDFSSLRSNLDGILRATSDLIPLESIVQLRRDPDGVWYAHFGIAGPGLTVTDRWLIVSYSPQAIRLIAEMVSPARQAAGVGPADSVPHPSSSKAPPRD